MQFYSLKCAVGNLANRQYICKRQFKFVNFVATRGKIFSLKFSKYRLAAGLHPDPLGELKRSPDPLAAIRGAYY